MNEILKVWKGQKVGDDEGRSEKVEERKRGAKDQKGGGEVDNRVK